MIANNKLRHRRPATLVILLVVLFFSGCGFHLRGQIVLPDVMIEPHLKGNNLELIHRLEEELRGRGARPGIPARSQAYTDSYTAPGP